MADSLVVSSKVREFIKASGCNTASDVAEALSKYVEKAVATAIKRTKANGRKTVRGSDL